MKTLILNDDVWAAIEGVLSTSQTGRDVLEILSAEPPGLPPSGELIRMARSKGETPEAFTRARGFRDAGKQAAEDTRDALRDLILEAHALGVGARVLSRWTGLQEARIYEIFAAARTSV